MVTPALAAKRLIFNGQPKEIFGTIIRVATTEDKVACGVNIGLDFLVVDFKYGTTNFRGLWRQSEWLAGGVI